jgi:hypothetical protein
MNGALKLPCRSAWLDDKVESLLVGAHGFDDKVESPLVGAHGFDDKVESPLVGAHGFDDKVAKFATSAENSDVLDTGLSLWCLRLAGPWACRRCRQTKKDDSWSRGRPKGNATSCDEEPAPEPSPQREWRVPCSIHTVILAVAAVLSAYSPAPLAFSAAKETIYLWLDQSLCT